MYRYIKPICIPGVEMNVNHWFFPELWYYHYIGVRVLQNGFYCPVFVYFLLPWLYNVSDVMYCDNNDLIVESTLRHAFVWSDIRFWPKITGKQTHWTACISQNITNSKIHRKSQCMFIILSIYQRKHWDQSKKFMLLFIHNTVHTNIIENIFLTHHWQGYHNLKQKCTKTGHRRKLDNDA